MTSNPNPLIAGQHGGKRIRIVPAVKPAFDQLTIKAKAGNHWARLAVLGLTSLASGRLGKNNIFVKPNLAVAHGAEEFFVFLPGCKACVERLPDDTYKIVNLVIDSGYFEMNSQNSRTGLYSVKKPSGQRWFVKPSESGKLTNNGSDRRFVAVTDCSHKNADDSANELAPLISKAPGAGGPFFKSFDVHFTQGSSEIGGLKNYKIAANPLSKTEVLGSAQLLANTMHKSKNIEGITWVSTFGGSLVLTQAMKILTDLGVELNNHSAYLYRPSSDTNQAVKLAHKLNMTLDRNFSHTNTLDYMGNRNQLQVIYNRFKSEGEYKIGHACFDFISQGTKIQGLSGLAVTAATLVGMPMALPAVPIFTQIASATGLTLGALKVGDSLAESVAPYWYNKHIGKIK